MQFDQITIIGVGLIGGSVGLAAKARGVARRVVGVDRDAEVLKNAVQLGAIDTGTTNLAEGVCDAEFIVVCTPVDRIAEVILESAKHVRPGTLFTDGGSTKQNILRELTMKLPNGFRYVPAHPLAGGEKNGVENASPHLFENRVTIVTTSDFGEAVEVVIAVAEFWESLGSRVLTMLPDDHDRALAVTSHLPHVVASAVAGLTPVDFLELSAGGFRDVTRIAAGDPKLWAAIFQANRDCVLSALDAFTTRLTEFRSLLESGDRAGIERWLTEGKQVRDALGT